MWVVCWIACSGEPERISSVPSPPAVELGDAAEGDPAVVWTELGGLFSSEVGLPADLAELTPGTSGARAREILDAAHRPGIQIMGKVMAGHTVLSSELKSFEGVGVTLILDAEGAALQQVDLSLPHDQALVLLGQQWGDPSETSMAEGKATYTWRGEPWTVELHDAGDKAVVKFR
jgi:hypothetical protein